MSAYHELEILNREITQLKEISAIMGWDEACMMPAAAGDSRGEALASLAERGARARHQSPHRRSARPGPGQQ